jgi:protease-4
LTYSSSNDTGETSTSTIEQQQEAAPAQPTPAAVVASASTNGKGASTSSNSKDDKDAPKHLDWVLDASDLAPLQFTPLSGSQTAWTNFKLAFALPWRRFKPEAVLTFKLEGEISDKLQGRFSPGFSMPQILDALEKAAVDPRVKGIAVEISPLAVSGSSIWTRGEGVSCRFFS